MRTEKWSQFIDSLAERAERSCYSSYCAGVVLLDVHVDAKTADVMLLSVGALLEVPKGDGRNEPKETKDGK